MVGADELTKRIARCVGIWETNRGGDDPEPKESALNTVAGIAASMATIEQATMPYAVDAISRSKALRDAAAPPLTPAELNAASDRCKAVASLLTLVAGSGDAPGDFINNQPAAIAATGLSGADVATMFGAVVLKRRIDALHADVEANRTTLDKAVQSVPDADRLGLGPGSMKSYIRKPANWGENRAGWQRKAVRAMSNNVGGRIEAVAVANGGTALAMPVIRRNVDIELARNPVPSEAALVSTVAQKNNPNEAKYGTHVLEIYQRLFP